MAGSQELSERWVAVLRTVVDACHAEAVDAVTTAAIANRLRDCPPGGRSSVRTLLRVLRRHGYVRTFSRDNDEPVRWAPTDKGRACLDVQSF